MDSLASLIQTGTRLWLDSIDPELVQENYRLGATGATSNPAIVADLIASGRFDSELEELISQGLDDDRIAWELTDRLVSRAQEVFLPVWERTGGQDGYVSFELEPLLEDPDRAPPHAQRVEQYVELGRKWSRGHTNRLIKVPATAAGLEALEPLAQSGVPLNVTLLFTGDQYRAARDAIWRGAQGRGELQRFKSVYSIFVSRVDVYTRRHVPQLSPAAQGLVGIVNAKRIWQENQAFWAQHPTPLPQEIVFASTGTKDPQDMPWKYVQAFAGSDIQTNPPQTNAAVQASGMQFTRQVDQLPSRTVLDEIDRAVDQQQMRRVLMEEGIEKFAAPQRALLERIAEKRRTLSSRS
jgi:transaldolase